VALLLLLGLLLARPGSSAAADGGLPHTAPPVAADDVEPDSLHAPMHREQLRSLQRDLATCLCARGLPQALYACAQRLYDAFKALAPVEGGDGIGAGGAGGGSGNGLLTVKETAPEMRTLAPFFTDEYAKAHVDPFVECHRLALDAILRLAQRLHLPGGRIPPAAAPTAAAPVPFAPAAALGAATAVKWSGLFAIAACGLWVVAVETLRIRTAHRGTRFVWRSALAALRSFALFVPVALVVYVSSWVGWILSAGGYSRSWAADAGGGDGPFGIGQALWKYHRDIYVYNIGLHSPHSYQADPFGWLAMIRPTAFYYAPAGTDGLVHYVTSVANPVVWWAGAIAIVALVVMVIRKSTWQNVAILVGVAATYVPWLFFSQRTVFQFYTVTLEPFLVLALVAVLVWLWKRHLRQFVANFLIIAVVVSAFFLPVWMGLPIPEWFAVIHYWFPSWI
jgi:hypothetical protein